MHRRPLHSCELSYEDINVDALCAGGVYDFERMWIGTAMDTAGNMHADTAYQYVEPAHHPPDDVGR